MSRANLLALFALGLTVAIIVASLQNSPGYMDADYYMAGGLRLVQGHGFSEMIVWNYLDDPQGLPHPSHSYWMPLASIIAAFGMWLTGQHDFYSARLPFILLAGLVPPLTSLLAYRLTERRELALLSGLLAAFPTYQAPFIATTSNFVIYNLLGAIFFIGLSGDSRKGFFCAGLSVGLMNLARSDGLLWLPLGFLAILLYSIGVHGMQIRHWAWFFVSTAFFVLFGYLLIMLPWFIRNLSEFGTLMAPGGLRAIFLVAYADTFAYPASVLTFERWLDSGWAAIIDVRVSAFWTNLGTSLAAQGGIVLWPFVLFAAWRLRRDFRIQVGVFAWLVLFMVMTIIFPFAGPRGSFYHAGASLLPLGWALAPVGLDFIVVEARRRNWFTPQAQRVFRVMLFAIISALTIVLINIRVINGDWDSSDHAFRQVEFHLQAVGANPQDIVMVTNPPGYYIASGRAAVVSPASELSFVFQSARVYKIRYLILQSHSIPERLVPFLKSPHSTDELHLVFAEPNVVVYEFVRNE